MATPEDCMIVRDALRGLCGTLHQFGKEAWEASDRVFFELDMSEEDHRGGRAHLARHVLRKKLRNAEDLGGWYLPRGCAPNGGLKLCRAAMTLKILRPGLHRKSVPHPGPNRARMYYYQNPLINLFGAHGSNLIGVWGIKQGTDDFELRLVRPIGSWGHLEKPQVDMDFFLPACSSDLEQLEFIPSDEELPLPFIDDEEEEDGDADSIGG